MLDINTQAQIRPYYKDNLDNDNQFVWEGLDGYGQDQNNEGDANVEQDTFEYKVLIPIASKGPNMVCWEQTDGEFKADKKVLYTLKFKEPGNVKSSEGDLYLPYVPADIYAWVQGHNLEFLGLAEVCKISPLSENTSFLIDGNNAENINTTKGFVFEF
jgi:hypothetical protein